MTCSFTPRVHWMNTEAVLRRLVDNNLAVNLAKSEFHVKETTFLGFVINGNETKMKSNKLDIIRDWPRPMTKKQTQMFLGFANYYRRFISHYSKIARPLTHITRNVLFFWESEKQAAFDDLKQAFLATDILTNFDR